MEPQSLEDPEIEMPPKRSLSVLGIVAMVTVAAVFGTGGYFLGMQGGKPAAAPPKATSSNQSASTISTFESCAEAGGDIYTKQVTTSDGTETAGTCAINNKSFLPLDDADLRSWTPVVSPQLTLTQFGVQLTMPSAAAGKLMYHYDPEGTYSVIPKGMLTNKQCSTYLDKATGSSDTFDGIVMRKLDPNTSAATELGTAAGTAQTINEYYTLHKASAGNYFTIPATNSFGGVKDYWSVGNNFYAFATTPKLYQGLDFAKDCPGLTGDYEQQITGAMPSMIPVTVKAKTQ